MTDPNKTAQIAHSSGHNQKAKTTSKTDDAAPSDYKPARNVGRVQWNRVVILSRGPNKRNP